jgi:hypothetical protein
MISSFDQALLELDGELDVHIADIKTWCRVDPLQCNMELGNIITDQQAQQVQTQKHIAVSISSLLDSLLLIKV